eukprot:6681619-Karenia_brevis.AAC.1
MGLSLRPSSIYSKPLPGQMNGDASRRAVSVQWSPTGNGHRVGCGVPGLPTRGIVACVWPMAGAVKMIGACSTAEPSPI